MSGLQDCIPVPLFPGFICSHDRIQLHKGKVIFMHYSAYIFIHCSFFLLSTCCLPIALPNLIGLHSHKTAVLHVHVARNKKSGDSNQTPLTGVKRSGGGGGGHETTGGLASNPGLPCPDFISQPWRKIGE